MSQYTTADKRTVTVEKLLGKGGEGEVYLVSGAGDQVAKIYHATHRTLERQHKLEAMLANPPQDDSHHLTPSYMSIAWPLDVLYERQQFAGFLMPRIDRSPTIFTIFNPALRRQRYPSFDWRYLHRTAANLATAMNALHTRGYVVGDVNQKNVLVTPSAMVTWVDTDSFQVPDATGRNRGQVYRCPVGVPDYTPPELQGINLGTVDRRPEHDCFGLAVMIFQLLMQGFHPFTGVPLTMTATPTGEIFRHNIEQGIFPHQANPHCAPPPAAPALAVLHPGLQRLFIRAFVDGHRDPSSRPTAREWLDELGKAEQLLVQCRRDSTHWYSSRYGQCHWCALQSRATAVSSRQQPLTPSAVPQPRVQPPPAPASIARSAPPAAPPSSPAHSGQSRFGGFLIWVAVGTIALVVAMLLPLWPNASAPVVTSEEPVSDSPTAVSSVGAISGATDAAEEILIPPGEFLMGCSPVDRQCYQYEMPQHIVALDAYYIDKYEVTNALYQTCVDAGACTLPAEIRSHTRPSYFGNPTFADYPVVNVTWGQAEAFCAWAGKRLPTEAEWENAARGGNNMRQYPWGNEAPDCTRLNYDRCVDDTSQVGSYPTDASPFGVMDMAGNVLEWTADWYDADYYRVSPLYNPTGPAIGWGRVHRGGAWYTDVSYVRSTLRRTKVPEDWGNGGGFRCARSQ